MEIMSSDESGYDEDDSNEVIVSHPLKWLSANVTQFKRKLDEVALKNKTPQAKRQMKERIEGLPSSRTCPKTDSYPAWVFNNNYP